MTAQKVAPAAQVTTPNATGGRESEIEHPSAPPEFDSTLESVRKRIVKIIGKVTVGREVTSWHPAVSRLLIDDEIRREKERTSSYVSSWEKPQFDSPDARRKLRILNALFLPREDVTHVPVQNGMRCGVRSPFIISTFGSNSYGPKGRRMTTS
jgi:hypothetical protein